MMILTCRRGCLIVCGFACALSTGCRPGAAWRPLTIVVGGDTDGWIVPCGCTSNQSGGLPRRASLFKTLRGQGEILPLDVGGAPHGDSPYDRAKFEAILRGEKLMGVAAHNLGAGEVKLGPDEIRRLAASLDFPLISANARDRAGRLVAEPMRVCNAAGRRVALIGALSERFATADVQVSPPRQAVLDLLQHNGSSFDAVIVLAYLPDDELRDLAEAIPEADVIVGGATGQPIAPKLFGPTLLASATNKGKFIVRLDAPNRPSERWTGDVIELNDRFTDDPQQVENVKQFRVSLAAYDFPPSQTGLVASRPGGWPKGFAVAGGDVCQKCHVMDAERWKSSKHAAAWKSLESQTAQADPECQRCHVTSYGLPNGFVSPRRSAAMTNVGCESCHGPSQSHAADPTTPTPHAGRASQHCVICHDRENSPKFDYDAYWRAIQHGQPANKGKS